MADAAKNHSESSTSLRVDDCCGNKNNNNKKDPNPNNKVQHSSSSSSTTNVRVSFRDDVVFTATAADNARSTSRTRTSTSSGGSGSGDESTSSSYASSSNNNNNKYANLRSNLTREQTNRDPFFFYQVTRNLGSGSIGDVKLVKKRADRVGGSARRDIQEAVKRQQREKECLNLPVLGNLFQFCIDGDLKEGGGGGGGVISDVSSHHHRLMSILSGTQDSVTDASPSRSFEDSLLNPSSSSTTTTTSSASEIIYAMKSIHLDQVTKKEYIDELRNEIAILKDLDHPNIVRAIETFEWKGKISIVMELCSGGDLYARDPYTEAEGARITSSILSAISYMHSRNVVHRDLKFENVLFVNASPMSEVKLIDFGLSKVYVDRSRELTDVSGTIYTMAPEVLLGNHTEKADMWSIGKCVCVCVCVCVCTCACSFSSPCTVHPSSDL